MFEHPSINIFLEGKPGLSHFFEQTKRGAIIRTKKRIKQIFIDRTKSEINSTQ